MALSTDAQPSIITHFEKMIMLEGSSTDACHKFARVDLVDSQNHLKGPNILFPFDKSRIKECLTYIPPEVRLLLVNLPATIPHLGSARFGDKPTYEDTPLNING